MVWAYKVVNIHIGLGLGPLGNYSRVWANGVVSFEVGLGLVL